MQAKMSGNQQSNPTRTELPGWTKFAVAAFGGAVGWLPIHPFDVTKVRMQIDEKAGASPSMIRAMKAVAREEGMLAFYNGLSAGLTRQLTYTAMRLGLYETFRDSAAKQYSGDMPMYTKLGVGLSAGAIAATVCCPIEVALVRMQADGAEMDPLRKRNYSNVFNAIWRVSKEEGFSAMYTGVRATVVRGMIVSCSQFVSYDYFKKNIRQMTEWDNGAKLHLCSAVCSGFVYTASSLPMDVVKSRMQNQKDGEYKSIPQAILRIIQREGILSLWKGFLPYFCRCGGHTITMFLCKEQVQKGFKKRYGIMDE